MTRMFDRFASAAAVRLVAWLEVHVDASKTEWVTAMASELDALESGWRRLAWAVTALPLAWRFRPRRAAAPELVLSGSAIMSESRIPASPRFQGRDVLSVLTALLLTVVVLGYFVFILPVFQNMIASTGQTLEVRGIDFAWLGINVARVAGLIFVGGLLYLVRRPVSEQARPFATMVGGVNVLLGASAILLGVTLIQFIILLLPALRETARGRDRVQAALYALATIDGTTERVGAARGAGAPELRFAALAKVVHEELRAGVTGPVADSTSRSLLALAPRFEGHASYGAAVQDANLLAGLVALEENRVAAAKRHLVSAGDARGSSSGPNMRLAKALLDRGERAVVVSFLQQCRRFWTDDGGQLDTWTAQINAGSVPDFRTHTNR